MTSSLRTHDWHAQAVRVANLLSIVLSLVLIGSITLETFTSPVMFQAQIYYDVQFWICLYFMAEFFILLYMAPRKGRFLARNFIFLLLCLPYLSLFKHLSLGLSDETIYLIRLIPIVRGGAALIMLTRMTIKNSVTSLFVSYIVLFLALCYFQILTFYTFESGVNPLVRHYGDAAWWAALTVTTVGSNIIAVTPMGKIATALLAMIGMTTFPIFTVYMTTLVQQLTQAGKRKTS